MISSRRQFIHRSLLATGAALFLKSGPLALAGEASSFSLDATDAAALAFIRRYTANTIFTGGSVAARRQGLTAASTSLIAEVKDFALLAHTLSGSDAQALGGLYAEGSQVAFTLGGRSFEVENLSSDTFAARRANFTTCRDLTFAHEAQQFSPASGTISDPLHSQNKLTLLRSRKSLAARLADVINGHLATKQFGLQPDDAFKIHQKTLVENIANRFNTASEVMTVLTGNVVAMADMVSSQFIINLLQTPLLSSAFTKAFGLRTGRVISQFKSLRSSTGSDTSDAALWLALTLSPQIEDNTVDPWIETTSRSRTLSARKALGQARSIITTASFTRLRSNF
ncbi:MAG: hypothetical protein QM796_01955 [Chthoniobacteraceae bacterium]